MSASVLDAIEAARRDLEDFLTLDSIERALLARDPDQPVCVDNHCPLEGLAHDRPAIKALLESSPLFFLGVGGTLAYIARASETLHRVELSQPVKSLVSAIDCSGYRWVELTAGQLLHLVGVVRAARDAS